jgi:hypothetical protein
MFHASPYQLFSPIHRAWLYRCDEQKCDVTVADLDSIEASDPRATDDILFSDYRRRADAGKLYRRRGRKPMTNAEYLRLWHARFEIEVEVQAIYSRRRAGMEHRLRSDREPCYLAAETIARRLKMPITGQWLVKKISKAGIV